MSPNDAIAKKTRPETRTGLSMDWPYFAATDGAIACRFPLQYATSYSSGVMYFSPFRYSLSMCSMSLLKKYDAFLLKSFSAEFAVDG